MNPMQHVRRHDKQTIRANRAIALQLGDIRDIHKMADAFEKTVIDTWKSRSSPDFAYFEKAESMTDGFWLESGVFLQMFRQLDTSRVLEIACGQGRHSARVAKRCGTLWIMDTSEAAISHCRSRFEGVDNIKIHLSDDGASLSFLPDSTVTSVFSYDAMVHFELSTMWKYVAEISRVLVPSGQALLHHSNYHDNPENPFQENPGWRNFMNEPLMRHICSRCDLAVVEYIPIDWAAPKSDALTLLRKKGASLE